MCSYGHVGVAGRDERDRVAAAMQLVADRRDDALRARVRGRRDGEHRRRDEQDAQTLLAQGGDDRVGRGDVRSHHLHSTTDRPTVPRVAPGSVRCACVSIGGCRDARHPCAQPSRCGGAGVGDGMGSVTVTRMMAGVLPSAESGPCAADTTSRSSR